MPQKLRDYDETRLSDDDILAGVRDLINGTHWVKDELETHCWVPLGKEETPEDYTSRGIEVEETWPGGSVNTGQTLCYRKAQYCIMGMVLKVADVTVTAETTKAQRVSQIGRVVERLFNCLPQDWRGRIVDPTVTEKVRQIEAWNDDEKTDKAKVRNLVTRALKKKG